MGLALFLAAGALIFLRRPTDASEPEAPRPGSQDAQGSPSFHSHGVAPAEVARSAAEEEPLPIAQRFDGRGTLRGSIETPRGVPFPEEWTLVLEPARGLVGGDRAVSRVVELRGAEQDFEVEDLPFGSYMVRPVAPGLNGAATAVSLERGSVSPYLMMRFTPTGFLEGEVVQTLKEGEKGVEAMPITVVLQPSGESRTAFTDIDGFFRFDDLLDGLYHLYVGDLENPKVPHRELSFRAPSMRFPKTVLDPMGTVRIQVIDAWGNPAGDSWLTGSGSAGGVIDDGTDGFGNATVRFLPPGYYELRAIHERLGQGSESFDLPPGAEVQVNVQLRP